MITSNLHKSKNAWLNLVCKLWRFRSALILIDLIQSTLFLKNWPVSRFRNPIVLILIFIVVI